MIPQPYTTIYDFMAQSHLTLPHKQDWRLTPAIYGAISGIPSSHGLLVATDGCLCYIRRWPDFNMFLGHVENFITDSFAERKMQICTPIQSHKNKSKSLKQDIYSIPLETFFSL